MKCIHITEIHNIKYISQNLAIIQSVFFDCEFINKLMFFYFVSESKKNKNYLKLSKSNFFIIIIFYLLIKKDDLVYIEMALHDTNLTGNSLFLSKQSATNLNRVKNNSLFFKAIISTNLVIIHKLLPL
jgi:hypothetical protein